MKMHQVKLIDGSFPVEKARTLLTKLLTDKINFHEKQKFSNYERFGNDQDQSGKRKTELIEEKQVLQKWLDSLQDNDELIIQCRIEIKVKG